MQLGSRNLLYGKVVLDSQKNVLLNYKFTGFAVNGNYVYAVLKLRHLFIFSGIYRDSIDAVYNDLRLIILWQIC